MGTGAFFTSVNATFSNGTLTSADAIEIVLGGSAGAWTLTTSEGQITTSKAKELKLNKGTQKTCTIKIDDQGAKIVFAGFGWIQYNASSPRFLNYNSGQTQIEIYKKDSGETQTKTLTSIAISGTPDKTEYKEGDTFDPAGLVVTGTYSEGDPEEITDGITWAFDPEKLSAGQTSVSVTATVGGVSSEAYTVDITVNGDDVDQENEVIDVLTADKFAATTTSYKDFSYESETSGAVYAGNSAKDTYGNIQLRSTNSESGIVCTQSAGIVSSVKITVGSGTKQIDVYGNNTPYTSAAELYATGENSNQGTKIGSLTQTGTIDFKGDYQYIGIRSYSGAIYLSSIEITWKTPTTVSVSSYGYATASFSSNVIVPAENTVFSVTLNTSSVTLTPIAAGEVIGANVGVMVYKENGGDVVFAATKGAATVTDAGLATGGKVTTDDYILGINTEDKFCFCHPSEEIDCAAGKAFLKGTGNESNSLRIKGATMIESLSADMEEDIYFDLQGRKVENPTAGLYILNGKKILVK